MTDQLMRAMILDTESKQLSIQQLPIPAYTKDQVLVKVEACGVCRTDLHIIDGDLKHPKPNIIPGHEIVGKVIALGSSVTQIHIGDRVGIPWLGETCGKCQYCLSDRENLCDNPVFTGYTRNGGYAEYTVANFRYCVPLNTSASVEKIAPLLCAGVIGWRSFKLAGSCKSLGLYGFGAAAHILCRVAILKNCQVYAFTRDGDLSTQSFARQLGSVWAGNSSELPPVQLDAAIIFAPVGSLVPAALKAVRKGGIVVCGGIHMSNIPAFSYDLLWEERVLRSVANLTRTDAAEFFSMMAENPISPETQRYNLKDANLAIADLRDGRINGAAVLIP